jgi:hypothetical protein
MVFVTQCAEFVGAERWRVGVDSGFEYSFPTSYDAVIREWAAGVRGSAASPDD